jgi:hypothetical protein
MKLIGLGVDTIDENIDYSATYRSNPASSSIVDQIGRGLKKARTRRGKIRTAQQRRIMRFAAGSRRASDSQGGITPGVAPRPLENGLGKS